MAISTIGTDALAASAVTTTKLASGVPSRSQLPAGTVLQVVSATKTDTWTSSTTGSWLDVTGLSVSITPTSSTSKIMIFGRITGGGTPSYTRLQMRLARDSTAISVGDASGSRLQVSGNELYGGGGDDYLGSTAFYLDSPSTTSAVTYKIQVKNGNTSSAIYVNRSYSNTDAAYEPNGTSSITVMEIAA